MVAMGLGADKGGSWLNPTACFTELLDKGRKGALTDTFLTIKRIALHKTGKLCSSNLRMAEDQLSES